VNGRYYTQYGSNIFNTASPLHNGGAVRIRFTDPCTITRIGLLLSANHSGGSHNYRLGIYSDAAAQPDDLLVDAGTLTISNTNGTAGMKELTLATPLSVENDTTYWLVCQSNNAGSLPALSIALGNLKPYTDFGLVATSGANNSAVAFSMVASGSSALPATFTLAATETVGATPAVYVRVAV
jgi:hypothetical protein